MTRLKAWKSLSILVALALVLSLGIMALPMASPVEASPGTIYYVATTGDDSRTAAEAQNPATPWKTISHAAASVPAGASSGDPNFIQVAAGTYDNTTNGETFPITLDSQNVTLLADSTAAIIDQEFLGTGTGTILKIEATGITIDGFTLDRAGFGIIADVGGFNILDNIFSNDPAYDIDYGVYVNISESELESAFTFDAILIDGNEFYTEIDGVLLHISLDYNNTKTGLSATIGDIDILANIFDMETTDGIDMYIGVNELTSGSISIGDINISQDNEFYDGDYGVYFDGHLTYLNDTTVTVGNLRVNDNYYDDQNKAAIYVEDYYYAEYWEGTTTASFGDLEFSGNEIYSDELGCDGVYINHYAYWEHFSENVLLTAGNIYIEDNNAIDVDGDSIYFQYYKTEYLHNYASITLGDLSIQRNDIDAGVRGIHLRYDGTSYEMYDHSAVTVGDVRIVGNIIDTVDDAIYFYYHNLAYNMNNNTTLLMGDIYLEDNDISGGDDGIYLYYYDWEVGYGMYNSAYAELPDYIITGNTFNVASYGIYLYTQYNPYYIYDSATFDFGGSLIDDNTFNGGDYGIYFFYGGLCYGNYNNSATIIGDVTITNNRFYNLNQEAIYIDYHDIGDALYDYSTLEVGDLVIAVNVIDGASYGLVVRYEYVHSFHDSVVTMGTLDIIGNDIWNVNNDGINVYYALDADNSSEQNIGRALIQGNTLDPIPDADGIYVYMSKDSEAGATINLGEPIIDRNIIEYWDNGIYLKDVDGATVTNNLIWHNNEGIYLDGCDNIQILYNDILTNPGPPSGVHLNGVCGGNTVIHYNNIVNNSSGEFGVDNISGNMIDAEYNWWGDPSGPDDPSGTTEVPPCTADPATEINADGLGDRVTSNVDYCPWLTQQSTVTIYEETTTATATGTASVQTGGGVTDFEAVDESTLPNAGKPDLVFTHGFFSFNIIGLTPGQTVTVTMTLPSAVPVGTEYWKYHASEGGWIQIPMGSDDGDNVITITLVDGGLGDDDLSANGVIVDQGGPGSPTTLPAVGGEVCTVNKLNVLAPWLGLILVLAIGGGIFALRRRQAH